MIIHMELSILDKINAELPKMTPRRRKACDFILNQPLIAGNMTLTELAEATGISGATLLRLAGDLGYSSFSSFKRELRVAGLQGKPIDTEIFSIIQQATQAHTETCDVPNSYSMLNYIPELTSSLKSPEFVVQFERAVQLLIEAKNIYTLGLNYAVVPAVAFEYIVGRITGNVIQLSMQQEYVYEKLSHATSEDILFTISSWPYAKRTIEVALAAAHLGIPIILLTNVPGHTLEPLAQAVLNTNSAGMPPYIAPNSIVIDLLANEIGNRIPPRGRMQLQQIEVFLKQKGFSTWE